VAAAFVELGYRRATTAEIARRSGVRENILYRLWKDKKAMFIDAIGHVHAFSEAVWTRLAASTPRGVTAAEHLIAYEALHHGEFGNYRILFTALAEADDPEILRALQKAYRSFFRLIRRFIVEHRRRPAAGGGALQASLATWALVGLGTVANLARELHLMDDRTRRRLIRDAGRRLL
jgi:AcrR family transcriptional regulator